MGLPQDAQPRRELERPAQMLVVPGQRPADFHQIVIQREVAAREVRIARAQVQHTRFGLRHDQRPVADQAREGLSRLVPVEDLPTAQGGGEVKVADGEGFHDLPKRTAGCGNSNRETRDASTSE